MELDELIERIASGPKSDSTELHESWKPQSLGDLVRAGLKREETTVLARKDGFNLFYSARLNMVFGESGAMKSWVCLLAAVQEVQKGNRVMILDYEDNGNAMAWRLTNLGLTADEQDRFIIYVQPETAVTPVVQEHLRGIIESGGLPVTLVIIDATTEAMSQEGLNTNVAEDAAKFYQMYPKLLAKLGPAVAVIDHSQKNNESGAKGPTGTQHKRAGVTGTALRVHAEQSFGFGQHGKSKLFVDKDKNGTVDGEAKNKYIGMFNALSDSVTSEVTAWIDAPFTTSILVIKAGRHEFTPEEARRMLAMMKDNPGESATGLRKLTGMATEKAGPLCAWLGEHGYARNDGSEKRPKWHFVMPLVDEEYEDTVPDV